MLGLSGGWLIRLLRRLFCVLLSVLWTAKGGECGVTALIVTPKLTAVLPDGRYMFDFKYRTPSALVSTIARGELNVLPTNNLELSYNQEVPPIGGGADYPVSARMSPNQGFG